MFQKNLEVLKVKNPELAQKLEKIGIKDIDTIQVYEAQSKDVIIAYNGQCLHNQVDPTKEAHATWVRSVKKQPAKNDIQIVFGLGLGYLFKRAYVNSESKIYVIEPFIDILRFVLEYVDFANELSDDRVYIFDSVDEALAKFKKEYLVGDRADFLFLPSYANIAQQEILSMTDEMLKLIESKHVDQSTIFKKAHNWTKNTVNNYKFYEECRPANILGNALSDKTAIVLAAGPSLEKDIELISNNKDNFVTIAVGKALKYLEEKGLKPDFACFADEEYLYAQTDGLEEFISGVNAVLATRSDSYVFSKDFNSKLLYFANTDNLAAWSATVLEESLDEYPSMGTVAGMAMYTAKILGCKNIVFSGLDLAFTDGKPYAGVNEDIQTVKTVKNKDGEEIPTKEDYAMFVRQFEDAVKSLKDKVSIFNTALKGAYIKGMEYKSLEEIIETTKDTTIDKNIVSLKVKETEPEWKNKVSKLVHELGTQKTDLENIHNNSTEIAKQLDEICDLFKDKDNNLNVLQTLIEKVTDKIKEERTRVINNQFIMNSMQNKILQYTQNYKTSIFQSIEDVEFNMKLEKEFFHAVSAISGDICEWIKEY